MECEQAPEQVNENINDEQKIETPNIEMAKLQAMVTPEQVLSASVARRRRTLTKKQSNRAREQTPCRESKQETTSDEEIIDKRPKTPERRRRKSRISDTSGDSLKIKETDIETQETKPQGKIEPDVSNTEATKIEKRRDSLINVTQTEVVALFNKAKRSITSGRDKAKHKVTSKEAAIRSQSVPPQFTADLIEGLRKARLLQNENCVESSSTKVEKIQKDDLQENKAKIKPYRPVVQEYVNKRKQQRRQQSAKVIEVLDPKTSRVVKKIKKGVPNIKFTFYEFTKILKYLTLREVFVLFKNFKKVNYLECRKISKLRNRCLCDIMVILIMCGLGGIMFKYVEGSFENFYKCGVKRVKRDFIDVLWYRSHNMREDEWKSLARNRLRTFEEELHVAHEAGMHSYSGQKSWSFLNAAVYCLTILTTIGYGHIYPTTVTGQALTIAYAIIGIPLFLIVLTDFGKLFTRCIKFFWSYVRRVYYTGSCKRVRNSSQVGEFLHGAQVVYEIATLRRPSMFTGENLDGTERRPSFFGTAPQTTTDAENPKPPVEASLIGSDDPTTPALSQFEIDDEFNLPISLAIFILVVYLLLGGLMYCLFENTWNFFASFYFVFISMSTIGFGDLVPTNPICLLASIFYLVFGLALMSMCINVVQVKLSDTFKDASAKLGATIGLEVNEDGSATDMVPVQIEVTDENDTKTLEPDKKSSLKVPQRDEGGEKPDEAKPVKEVKF